MKKLLVLCPSRGRPDRIMGMLESFEKTTNHDSTRIQVLLDKDDPCIKEYFRVLPSYVKIKVFDRQYDKTLTTEILNRAFLQDDDFEFYSVTNDDMEYLTKGWDDTLCVKGKISTGIEDNMVKKYGEDFISGIHVKGFPQTSVIDGDIIRALGWVQYPKLRHSAGDNVWYWIARRMNILHIDESVHYRHRSAYFKDGEEDETFKSTSAQTNMDDFYIYKDWLKYKCADTINQINHSLNLIKKEETCLNTNHSVEIG